MSTYLISMELFTLLLSRSQAEQHLPMCCNKLICCKSMHLKKKEQSFYLNLDRVILLNLTFISKLTFQAK